MKNDALTAAFDAAVDYDDYITSSPDKTDAFQAISEQVTLTPQHAKMLCSWTRDMRLLVISGTWCGDCVRQVPVLAAIAAACPHIDLRFLDRDHPRSPIEHFRINGGDRVPVGIFMAEDGAYVSAIGDKTLSYYRWVAKQQLGPACPLPGAPIPDDVLDSIMQDWIDECERVQLLLRLSPRLRSMHGD
jgi:hypothetical protein